jgi:hypothetical protein
MSTPRAPETPNTGSSKNKNANPAIGQGFG